MKNRLKSILIITAIVLNLFAINSCEKEKIYPPVYEPTMEFYSLMDQWYLWRDSIADVDVNNFSSPEDLLSVMRYEPRDKWSYITTKEAHAQYYTEGSFVGYGFGYDADSKGKIRITYAFEQSVFYEQGIGRGWILNKINGVSVDENSDLSSMLGENNIGVENTFEFESPLNEILTKTLSKKLITMNTIIHKEVLNEGVHKIGYFVFKSFIGPSIEEITETLNYFKTQAVDELIVDLRYNGGGRMDVVNHLAGYIIPDNLNGKLFYRYVHNNNNTNQNAGYNFEQNSNSLRLNKVYFIAGKGSASASEAIINGLDPYIDVYIVGNDTYGKPVGMYSVESKVADLIYVPVTFSLVNSNGYGGYYNGLKADSYVDDDVENTFGKGEAIFDEVLQHINTGSFTSIKSSLNINKNKIKEICSIKDEIGAL